MTNTFYSFIVTPIVGWLTLMSVLVVAYLGRLEYLERRKNRRLDEKRLQLSQDNPLRPKSPRRLAMRELTPASESACLAAGRAFQKMDRHASLDFRPASLN